jgi:hypothetical protein
MKWGKLIGMCFNLDEIQWHLIGMGFNPFHKRTINPMALAKMMLR